MSTLKPFNGEPTTSRPSSFETVVYQTFDSYEEIWACAEQLMAHSVRTHYMAATGRWAAKFSYTSLVPCYDGQHAIDGYTKFVASSAPGLTDFIYPD